jgi:hypothetical protein
MINLLPTGAPALQTPEAVAISGGGIAMQSSPPRCWPTKTSRDFAQRVERFVRYHGIAVHRLFSGKCKLATEGT